MERERRETLRAAHVRAGAATGSTSCKPQVAPLTVVSASAGIFRAARRACAHGKHSTERREREVVHDDLEERVRNSITMAG